MLAELVESGRIVDVMLAVVAVEIIALLAWRRLRGSGLDARALLLNVGAGASLMLALKLKFVAADWRWLAGALLLALAFHVADVAWRWRHAD